MEIPESYKNLYSFQWHETAKKYLTSEAQTRCAIKGNQGGGTAVTTTDAGLRVLGAHPVEKRNRLQGRPIRFVSKVVPEGPEDENNQQYVEFKRRLPPEFIKQDITARRKIMIIRDPYGGADNKAEFMASTQEIDAFMSVQRSCYYQDEEISRTKFDENLMRLMEAGGDVSLSLTPVRGLDWTYDSIWKKASKIYRSKAISDKFGLPRVETGDHNTDIEVFCWATDDNPVMDLATIDNLFQSIDDPDELAMRRYGVFRQVSGRIYKCYEQAIHFIPYEKYFDASLFRRFWNYRIIDFHPRKPWDVSFVAVSPTHEWFVWNEMHATHDNRVTLEMRDDIKAESLLDEDDEYNRCTLIDPLANVKQGNTGFTTFQDLSMGEEGLRRLTPADTKNEQGRLNIKMRLKNSTICGVPNNNLRKTGPADIRYGEYLPTIWFLNNCRGHNEHFRSWREVDFKQEHVKAVRTVKRESEKWSDYCRNLEFLGALNPVYYERKENDYHRSELFQGRVN